MVAQLLKIHETQQTLLLDKYDVLLSNIEVRIEEGRQHEPEPMQEEDDTSEPKLPLERLKQKLDPISFVVKIKQLHGIERQEVEVCGYQKLFGARLPTRMMIS